MKEFKITEEKLNSEKGKKLKKDLLTFIEEESIDIESLELENSDNLYIVLKDR